MEPTLRRSPCLRGYNRPSAYVAQQLREKLGPEAAAGNGGMFSPSITPPEHACAAEVSFYCDVALKTVRKLQGGS
jgi:hypothetical protein